jgi:hypothetical protein
MKTKTVKKPAKRKAIVREAESSESIPISGNGQGMMTKTMALVPVDPQALLSQAIGKGLPLESIERLLAMRRELKAEWARERFFEDLPRFQAACPIIGKSKKAKGKNFNYSYAPMEEIVSQIKKPLEQFGFSYTIVTKQTGKAVTAICNAHHVDGHTESSEFTIPIDPEAYMNDSQKIASAMTYATRYALRNAFGIVTGDLDDDGESTGDRTEQKTELRPPQARNVTPPAESHPQQVPAGPYAEIMSTLNIKEKSKEGPLVALFGAQEKMEWKTKADGARGNQEELKDVLQELQQISEKRRNRVKEGL